jgi:hypothetical protein
VYSSDTVIAPLGAECRETKGRGCTYSLISLRHQSRGRRSLPPALFIRKYILYGTQQETSEGNKGGEGEMDGITQRGMLYVFIYKGLKIGFAKFQYAHHSGHAV